MPASVCLASLFGGKGMGYLHKSLSSLTALLCSSGRSAKSCAISWWSCGATSGVLRCLFCADSSCSQRCYNVFSETCHCCTCVPRSCSTRSTLHFKRCTVCRVFARVRPLLPEEVAAAAASPVRLLDKDHVQLYSERTGNRFTYELDCVFDPFTASVCMGRPYDPLATTSCAWLQLCRCSASMSALASLPCSR